MLEPAEGSLTTGVVADHQKLMREAFFGEVPPLLKRARHRGRVCHSDPMLEARAFERNASAQRLVAEGGRACGPSSRPHIEGHRLRNYTRRCHSGFTWQTDRVPPCSRDVVQRSR
jgi:hypothetical protein